MKTYMYLDKDYDLPLIIVESAREMAWQRSGASWNNPFIKSFPKQSGSDISAGTSWSMKRTNHDS